ncbi:MAG: lipopolysaccharide biosynthesis protein [Halioglobus sp.]
MNKTQEESKQQIKLGLSWNVIGLFVNKGASIIVRLVLARLLVPEDFGVIAMITVVLGLIGILCDFGLKNALIQRSDERAAGSTYDSVFWLLLCGGFFWTALFMIAGIPLMLMVFDESGLVDLALIMGLVIPLQSSVVVPEARLIRDMHFKSLVTAEMASTLSASILAISMAFAGFGVWSLVVHELSANLLRTGLIWRFARWRPTMRFSWEPLRELAGFSRYMLGNQLIHYARTNMDRALIGAILGTASLGVYTLAFMLTETIRSRITGMVSRVMFPVYSRLQHDKGEVARLIFRLSGTQR